MKKTKFSIIAFRLLPEDKEKIEKIASNEFHTTSQWIYKIIKNELNKRDTEELSR